MWITHRERGVSDTEIRISTDTRRQLDLHRRNGESYEAVIRRLADRDRWAGFGAFDGTDADGTAEGSQNAERR